MPGRRIESLREDAEKFQQCHKHYFNTVDLLPKDIRFEHGGAKLLVPGAI